MPSLLQSLFGMDFIPYLPSSSPTIESPLPTEDGSLEESEIVEVNPELYIDTKIPEATTTKARKSLKKVIGHRFRSIARRNKTERIAQEQEMIADGSGDFLALIQERSRQLRLRAIELDSVIGNLAKDVDKLQLALRKKYQQLESHSHTLSETERELHVLQQDALRWSQHSCPSRFSRPPRLIRGRSATEEAASLPEPEPLRRRSNTDPRILRHSSSSSFIRTSDLGISEEELSVSSHSDVSKRFFDLDQNLPLILMKLSKLGLAIVTDDSARFTATRDTQRLLSACSDSSWPVRPWYSAKGKDILVWTGQVDHKGFGHDWPVVKARGVVRTSPRKLLDFLLDSSKVKLYNKMSQGREELLVVQEGVDTEATDSEYGFAGDLKIMRALNKPKLLPKTIEMLSLWYTTPLEVAPDSYMIVSRSVWENESGTPKASDKLRSEMLLGVQLLRPCSEGCELTTITHVYSPGVPELLAKRQAPMAAQALIRDLQAVFA